MSANPCSTTALMDVPAIALASNPEVDIEVLESVPKQFAIIDDRSANWLVKRIVAARDYADRVKQWAEQEQRRAAREEQTLLYLFGRQAEEWAREEIAKTKSKRKSLNLPAGPIGFRRCPARLVVDDEATVLEWARTSCPAAVQTVERLSKSALNTHFGNNGELPPDGARVDPAQEKFFVG